ncbi:MAG: biopolymer transporter ExbD [Halomonadaceae bacterium]|nr:MAG: biopolymer transporter ExbD [Halomonadaceae bacterium]
MQWLEPRPHRRLPIRLTPLIDVVFILLLFFMLTSRLTPMGLVQLETTSADSQQHSDEPLPSRLHLGSDGSLSWNGDSLDREALLAQLQSYSGDRVQLSTGETVPLSEFTFWLGEIRQQNLHPSWHRGGTAGNSGPEGDAP